MTFVDIPLLYQIKSNHIVYYVVLYCAELYCTELYCTVLYCTILNCTVLYWTVLYCTVLYCTELYCTELYCTELYTIFRSYFFYFPSLELCNFTIFLFLFFRYLRNITYKISNLIDQYLLPIQQLKLLTGEERDIKLLTVVNHNTKYNFLPSWFVTSIFWNFYACWSGHSSCNPPFYKEWKSSSNWHFMFFNMEEQ